MKEIIQRTNQKKLHKKSIKIEFQTRKDKEVWEQFISIAQMCNIFPRKEQNFFSHLDPLLLHYKAGVRDQYREELEINNFHFLRKMVLYKSS